MNMKSYVHSLLKADSITTLLWKLSVYQLPFESSRYTHSLLKAVSTTTLFWKLSVFGETVALFGLQPYFTYGTSGANLPRRAPVGEEPGALSPSLPCTPCLWHTPQIIKAHKLQVQVLQTFPKNQSPDVIRCHVVWDEQACAGINPRALNVSAGWGTKRVPSLMVPAFKWVYVHLQLCMWLLRVCVPDWLYQCLLWLPPHTEHLRETHTQHLSVSPVAWWRRPCGRVFNLKQQHSSILKLPGRITWSHRWVDLPQNHLHTTARVFS